MQTEQASGPCEKLQKLDFSRIWQIVEWSIYDILRHYGGSASNVVIFVLWLTKNARKISGRAEKSAKNNNRSSKNLEVSTSPRFPENFS